MFGYTNANYAGDIDKRRSTLGYVFIFIGGVDSWRFQLQNCTSMSTTKAKYIASFFLEVLFLEISVVELHIHVNHRS